MCSFLTQTTSNEPRSDAAPISEIRSWASQLASEYREPTWFAYYYIWPSAIRQLLYQLEHMKGGLIALVGFQGVGKTSALHAIHGMKIIQESTEYRKKYKSEKPSNLYSTTRFKWRREPALYETLLNGTHEDSTTYLVAYRAILILALRSLSTPIPEEILDNPDIMNISWAERRLGKNTAKQARTKALVEMLNQKKTILIDTPDYSRTDKRMIAKDLDEIYWLWNLLAHMPADNKIHFNPNIVIAVQKEMFGDHYFFDKMTKIELEPLKPEQMVEAYMKRFKKPDPFTEDALLTLARMSRGIFRRYLRYIMSTLDQWEYSPKPHGPINVEIVNKAVTPDRLAQDMEYELQELFPRQSDLRLQAVRLLMHLSESGSKKQIELAEELNMQPYAVSRLLEKLELHRYVTRKRVATDKVVSIHETPG